MAAINLSRLRSKDRKRWGLADDDPGPVSLPKMTFVQRARGSEKGRADTADAPCPPVPANGPGKDKLDEIVREARRIGHIHNPKVGLEGLAAGLILAGNSKTGGRWDIKNLRDRQGRKLYPNGGNFGNFLYGATSTGMGFSPTVSDVGADLYSLWDNHTLEREDDKIRAGQKYARLKCDRR